MRNRISFVKIQWLLLMCWLYTGSTQAQTDGKGLKDYYGDYFSIGVAVSPKALKSDEAALIKEHFNSVTAENAMKSALIHPRKDMFYWKDADSIVSFAQRNKMKIRGHTLVWHNQNPNWLFVDEKGVRVSKDVLLERLKTHIYSVVGRYKGRIYAWDVVNEAISDAPGEYLRKTPWLEICGEEYIQKAFQWAHEADPDAVLFYNDYNEIDPVKRGKIIRLVSSLREAGVPIHGVGLQAHWAVDEPTNAQLESTLNDFSKLGLALQITELDVSVYKKEHSAREKRAEDEDAKFTAEKEQKQRDAYRMFFELFRKYNSQISSVTFWNISDRDSWLDNFPVKGRKDFPLLFDEKLQPKKVYFDVIKF